MALADPRLRLMPPITGPQYYTHVYTGPNTKWGLRAGTRVRIVGRRAGGVQVKTEHDPRVFLVGAGQVHQPT